LEISKGIHSLLGEPGVSKGIHNLLGESRVEEATLRRRFRWSLQPARQAQQSVKFLDKGTAQRPSNSKFVGLGGAVDLGQEPSEELGVE